MLHMLRRHPIAISARFERVLVLTYAFPRDVLAPLLPPGLELDLYEDLGFLAIATVKTRSLRPSFLPAAVGRHFFLTGYRIFTRFPMANGKVLRGLKILRSDTDSAWMTSVGNVLTHYGYRKAEATIQEREGQLEIAVVTPRGEADLTVTADLRSVPAPLPVGSPFPDIETARMFAGPLPHTFDYEAESDSMIVVRGLRQNWTPQPVRVEVARNTFLESPPFDRSSPRLANAFYLSNVPYKWERGRREAVLRK